MYAEKDIAYENGDLWVLRRVSKNPLIASIGSVYYEVFKTGTTHSISTGYVTANYNRAKAYCDKNR